MTADAFLLDAEQGARLLGRVLGFSILPAYLLIFVALMLLMTQLTFRVAKRNRLAEALLPVSAAEAAESHDAAESTGDDHAEE